MSVQLGRSRRSQSPESVFMMPESAFMMAGIGVHVAPESVFTFVRNRRSESSGTRTT
jgi:hypothetical protein